MYRELDLVIEQYMQVLGMSVETASLLIDSLADRATVAIGVASGQIGTSERIQTIRMMAELLRQKIK